MGVNVDCEMDACLLYDRIESELYVLQEELMGRYGDATVRSVRSAFCAILRSRGHSWSAIAKALGRDHPSGPHRAYNRIRDRFRSGTPTDDDVLAMCVCRGAFA